MAERDGSGNFVDVLTTGSAGTSERLLQISFAQFHVNCRPANERGWTRINASSNSFALIRVHSRVRMHSFSEWRNVLAAVPENARHPDQLVQKLRDPANILFVFQFSLLVERVPHFAEIHVRKRDRQTELADDRHQLLDHART